MLFNTKKNNKSIAESIIFEKKPVYLYGAGTPLGDTVLYLKEHNIPILAIIDKNEVYNGQFFEGIPYILPKMSIDKDIPVIITTRLYIEEISTELSRKGHLCILPFYYFYKGSGAMERSYARKRAIEESLDYKEKELQNQCCEMLVLDSIDLILTERCSLRCRDCANLMQYYVNPKDEDYDTQIKALIAIAEACDMIREIRVLGGEPFMSQEVYRYIKSCLSHDNVGMITVYTNGTIVPQGENLDILINDRVFVRISDYGRVSKNIDELTYMLDEKNILYEIMVWHSWQDCSGFYDRNRSDDELVVEYDRCCTNNTFTLKGGILYGCPFAANADALSAIPHTASDGIDVITIDSVRDLRQRILFLKRKPFYGACRFCSGRPSYATPLPAAVQSDVVLPYKVVGEQE